MGCKEHGNGVHLPEIQESLARIRMLNLGDVSPSHLGNVDLEGWSLKCHSLPCKVGPVLQVLNIVPAINGSARLEGKRQPG